MDSIQELEAVIEKIRRERFALRNRLDDPAVKQLDQQLAQQQIQLIEQVNKLNRAQQDPNAAPVQRGSNPLPPNVQTLVNKARQLSRSIAATGPAGPDSIAQALAIVQQARSELDILRSSSFVSQSAINDALATLNEAQESLNKSQEEENKEAAQPQPPATASQTAQDDAPKGPNATPAQEVGADGRVTSRAATAPATNADKVPVDQPGSSGETTGTDAPVKTGEQTQSVNTNSNSGQAVPAPASTNASARSTAPAAGTASAPIQAGQSAKDDGTTKNTTNTQAAVNATDPAAFKVVTQPNVLDQFSSYTYSASVYLLTSDQYNRLLRTKNKRIDGYQLLFQSGGAPANVFGARAPADNAAPSKQGEDSSPPQQTGPDDGRNPFFPDDFYIDSITINSQLMGKGSGSSHMTTDLKFTVVEPNGITLLDCLRDAVFNAAPRGYDGTVNYTAAQYLLVIRFHGYDENGQLVSPIKGSVVDRGGNKTDPTAAVEKFIPFAIKQINWSVGSKMVSYEWNCAPVDLMIAGHTARGTIPYDVQLVDSTVGGLLGNNLSFAGKPVNQNDGSYDRAEAAKYARQGTRPPANGFANTGGGAATGNPNLANQANRARRAGTGDSDGSYERAETAKYGRQAAASTKAPAKADAAPAAASTNAITQGLCGAMNQFQADLVKRGVYTYPDNYSIRFEDGVDGTPGTAISGAKLQLPNTKVDKAKTASGAPPSQAGGAALDPARNATSNVTRVFSITAGMQMLQAIDLVIRNSSYISGQSLVTLNEDGTQEPRPENKNKKMKWYTVTMEAEPGQTQDPLRNDFAYNITYVVRPFVLQNFESRYFPRSDFGGIHKSYPFWFTGENIAVLDYQETLNAMYQLTVSGGDPKATADKLTKEFVTSDAREILKYNYSPRSNQSSHGADGKEFEANANAAEVLYSPSDLANAKVKIIGDPAWIAQGNFFVDLSNTNTLQQIQESGFEPDGTISFNTSDVMFEMVWQRPQDYDLATGLADPFSKSQKQDTRKGIQSRVYMAKSCVSEFRGGRFEQTIEGVLKMFPIPGKTNATGTDGKQNQTAAEDARLRAANEKAKGRSSGLTDKQAQQARADFAARDPRRQDLNSSAGSNSAAVQGAQQGSPRSSGATAANPADPRQGRILTNLTSGTVNSATLLPAGPPQPASSGSNSGTVVPVAEQFGNAPPKMPAVGPGRNTLTVEQRREVNRRAIAQTNRELAEEYEPLAASSSPVSSSIPSNQPMAKDY